MSNVLKKEGHDQEEAFGIRFRLLHFCNFITRAKLSLICTRKFESICGYLTNLKIKFRHNILSCRLLSWSVGNLECSDLRLNEKFANYLEYGINDGGRLLQCENPPQFAKGDNWKMSALKADKM